ncbi:hypothetical protein B4168_4163 [Anoxybacillus flavithermus]|nr:hypothetical protein B4168_4163 [Anoxybacillus flavithermus]OAO87293.1 hypothetical protein GT23_1342 [Parageobacillus thermoglucosidasius]
MDILKHPHFLQSNLRKIRMFFLVHFDTVRVSRPAVHF